MSTFLSHSRIDVTAVIARVAAADRGAIATFLGVVRDHQDGRSVVRLEYSAYEAMAEVECARIVTETERCWPVRVALEHRVGPLSIGDVAVAIAVASGHRAAAFDACRHLIETVKQRVPIWKKEFYRDGEVRWVDPTRLPAAPVAEVS